jgi:DNA-binding NarL/FixJ family response regulator
VGSPDTRPAPDGTGVGRVPSEQVVDVVLVDDHPAVLAGLVGLVELEPGLACVATATSGAAALEAIRDARPRVVVVDYELPDTDGLTLCAELKSLPDPPGVVVYSAFASPSLLPAAAIAGADAMLDKADRPEELFRAVHGVARGAARLPAPPPQAMQHCFAVLDADDLPLFGMAVNGVPPAEIADVVGVDIDEVRRRLRVLLGRLQPKARPPSSR